ncbi:hypothetical protein SCHPADRAFT_221803 [Schizopora paradoxa]|uniref:Uncharacterized protein n=1 Tax=Schizopora paradoxa TaxID=27342 RepID=A0A0H2RXD6_9AGAM|nr:hypothetical protein SCHPADRAFT_221803 [Schizopora paradoxa]
MTEIANNNTSPTTPARPESFEVPSLPSFNSPEFADRAGRHVNVLFKDVREATKAVKSAIARFNAVDNAAAKQNGYLDIRDVFIQFQNDLWTLRGLLYEVKASVLEVLVDTDKGRDSFNRLKEHLQKITSEVQSMQYGTLTAFAHDWDGNLIYSPTVQSLRSLYSDFSVNYRYFRELYLPCDRLVGSFKTKPFRVTYSLPQTVLKEGSSDLPQRIVSLGQTLEPIAIQLGKLYIDKAVGSEPVSVSKLREAQVDVLQNLDVFVGGPILEKEGPMPSLHESIQKEIERARSQRFCVAFCGMVKAGRYSSML